MALYTDEQDLMCTSCPTETHALVSPHNSQWST